MDSYIKRYYSIEGHSVTIEGFNTMTGDTFPIKDFIKTELNGKFDSAKSGWKVELAKVREAVAAGTIKKEAFRFVAYWREADRNVVAICERDNGAINIVRRAGDYGTNYQAGAAALTEAGRKFYAIRLRNNPDGQPVAPIPATLEAAIAECGEPVEVGGDESESAHLFACGCYWHAKADKGEFITKIDCHHMMAPGVWKTHS